MNVRAIMMRMRKGLPQGTGVCRVMVCSDSRNSADYQPQFRVLPRQKSPTRPLTDSPFTIDFVLGFRLKKFYTFLQSIVQKPIFNCASPLQIRWVGTKSKFNCAKPTFNSAWTKP